MRIIVNPKLSQEEILELRESIRKNDGYCPCKLNKTKDTKCMCKEFREQKSGECHCGLYNKTEN